MEDVNSVLINDRVNDFHSLDTSLRSGLDSVLLDFVRVRKTVSGFSFDVDNSLWTGGFYLTTAAGEYISLTSSDYSYSDGVLSVDTSESDVVLVLYCSSFYSVFSLQYLNCCLESLFSVVNNVSVTTDDFISLNGTPITSSDITVVDTMVTCRNNTFYKDIVELEGIPVISVTGDALIAGSPVQPVTLESSEDITGVTVEYEGVSEFVEFTEGVGVFNVDLSEHLTTDNFNFRVVFKGIVFELTAPVSIIEVNTSQRLKQALASKIRIIRITSYTPMGYPTFDIDYDVTILCRGGSMPGTYKIHDGVTFTLDNHYYSASRYRLFEVGENTNITFTNCRFNLNYGDLSIIFANEDLSNTNSKIVLDNCSFNRCDAPVIFFDGELEIRNSRFEYPIIASRTGIFEPCFIHLTGGKLTMHNTVFKTMNNDGSAKSMGGYNLACILLGEDTTFNGVNATELSKGNPSLNQAGITSTMNVNYQNGDETVHLTDGFYIAVEDKKIKNIKED